MLSVAGPIIALVFQAEEDEERLLTALSCSSLCPHFAIRLAALRFGDIDKTYGESVLHAEVRP